MGSGDLDLFFNYLGFAEYAFTQVTYLYPIGPKNSHDCLFYLGPETMAQGNAYDSAVQLGAALAVEWTSPGMQFIFLKPV